MITTDNIKSVLEILGFVQNGEIFEKQFHHFNCSLKVDFSNKKLVYPEAIKGRERNDDFEKPENFVVFECVNRLLEKGYRPEHIELEKVWQLGHEQKGGRADVCISNVDGSMLFIIECKTYGREFDKYYKKTLADGDQLFSYWQQEQSCKWLVLYASDLKNNHIEYKAPTIGCKDDENIILLAKKDKTIKLYRNAHTAQEKYAAWKETYLNQIHEDLIFTDDSIAYQIGVKPLRKKDLLDFTPDDKIVNRFEEILRHNNVSDKENAFNRLIALFICKLADESTKGMNDEVEFQYKQGTDTYETLQDRLQRLHRDGMKQFMREDILYVRADYPEWLFSTFTGTRRKKAIEDLQNTIKILKFYSNNDFAFKEVHNEELFYQNGKILVEMVQLFEKYRIVYPSKHQFLGDLFEQLLNKGFKQNEGQYFTPMPITRFIWDCLPVDRLMRTEKGTSYPKVIDYACGAGHFLTEAVEAINYFAQSEGNNSWVRDHIFGIEKDYRLARVAKISLFMNGAGEGNIVFGDGLESVSEKGIENGTFDILVANPPYSVKDFKQHLKLKNNSFTLLNRIGLNGSEIEVLFVERIAQLLKPQGIAAVILPSSILSNDSSSYTGAREELLKNFYIRGIAAFGSKTFGATGTNTVVLFLEKYNEPPKQFDLLSDSIDSIFSGADLDEWKDKDILESYLSKIDVEEDEYQAFIRKERSIADWEESEYFKMYVSAFTNSADALKLIRSKAYRDMNAEEKKAAFLSKFYTYTFSIEKEKLLYFSLVYQQTTVIVTAPVENKSQKAFLGYEWSNRKGNEGIQIITPGGKMYDDSDRTAEGTLANAIKRSFCGLLPILTDEQQTFCSIVNTKDMIDFSRGSCNKTMNLKAGKKIRVDTKYPTVPLGTIADVDVQKGTAITETETTPGLYKVVAGGKRFAYLHNQYNREAEIITVSASGINAGYVNYWAERIFASDCTTIQARTVSQTKWLYYYLKLIQPQIISILQTGAGQPHVYPDDIKLIPVPDISDDLQKIIVAACAEVDGKERSLQKMIEHSINEIENLFAYLDTRVSDRHRFSIANHEQFDVAIGKRVLNKQLVIKGAVPVYSANIKEPFGYVNELLITDFSVPSVLWGIDGDWMTGYIPENKEFYPTDHCGVLRCKTSELNPCYLAHILEVEGRKKGFSRSYRASIDRILGISFTAPDITLQNEIVGNVIQLENKIHDIEEQLEKLSKKKMMIIQSYLN
ncbi:MAG: N-6 DNA methylase [Clostridia bacterium]|nr:N-6 DNA methylase [Clostridia bacterium]